MGAIKLRHHATADHNSVGSSAWAFVPCVYVVIVMKLVQRNHLMHA